MSFAFSITLFSSVDNDTPVISLNRITASPTEDAKSDYKRTHQLYKKNDCYYETVRSNGWYADLNHKIF